MNSTRHSLHQESLLKIQQEYYVPIVLETSKTIMKWDSDAAIVLFGSVAQGTAKFESDIDLLVVSEKWGQNYSTRWPILYEWKQEMREKTRYLWDTGIFTQLSLLPLTPSELEGWTSFFIDIVGEELILSDPQGKYERFSLQLRSWLIEIRAQRRFTSKGRYYWDLGSHTTTSI